MKKLILFVIMLSMLLGLGVWQVFRLQHKNEVIEKVRDNIDVVDIYHSSELKFHKYNKIRLEGFFVPKKIFYYRLVNNKPGYETLVPFIMEDGAAVLVSIGWSEDKRDQNISITKKEIEGRLLGIYKGNIINPENDLKKNEWFSLNKKDIESRTGLQVKPYLILLSKPEDILYGMKIPFDIANIPNKHLEYAITWFSLALVLMIIFAMDWRNRR